MLNENIEKLFENLDLPRDPAWIEEVNLELTKACLTDFGLAPKITHAENGSITMEFEDGSKIELLETVH